MKLKYTNWKDITVDLFLNIQQRLSMIEKTGDEDIDNINRYIVIISCLSNKDEDVVADLDVNEFGRLVRKTAFLNDMPKAEIKDRYKVNGNIYDVYLNLQQMTMAQYIDFQTFYKEKDKYTKQILACFLIPKGKKYCEDYKIEDVINDIGKMSIVDAYSIMFFFTLIFTNLTKTMLGYSTKKMKKMMRKEKNEEKKKKIQEAITQIQMVQTLVENGDGLGLLR